MCGRINLARPADAIIDELAVDDWSDSASYATGYNLAPTRLLPVLFAAGGRRVVRCLQWGLVPTWANERGGGARLINARCETVAVKPSFRHLLGRRHCVAMADGYYEWPEGSPTRQPYHIRRADGRLILMAALWDTWSPTGEARAAGEAADRTDRSDPSDLPDPSSLSSQRSPAAASAASAAPDRRLYTFTIITTSPNPTIAALHDRMPVILEPDDVDTWLTRGDGDLSRALSLMRPSDAELAFHFVSTRVNAVRHDDPSLIEPVPRILPPASHPDLFE